jgi:hypothetical protein
LTLLGLKSYEDLLRWGSGDRERERERERDEWRKSEIETDKNASQKICISCQSEIWGLRVTHGAD